MHTAAKSAVLPIDPLFEQLLDASIRESIVTAARRALAARGPSCADAELAVLLVADCAVYEALLHAWSSFAERARTLARLRSYQPEGIEVHA